MGFLRTDRDHADFEAETQPDQALSLQVLPAVMMVVMVVMVVVVVVVVVVMVVTMMMIHIPKAYGLTVNLSYLETILVHPTRRQNFAGKLHLYFCDCVK